MHRIGDRISGLRGFGLEDGVFSLGGSDQGQQRQWQKAITNPASPFGHRLVRSGLGHLFNPSVRFDQFDSPE